MGNRQRAERSACRSLPLSHRRSGPLGSAMVGDSLHRDIAPNASVALSLRQWIVEQRPAQGRAAVNSYDVMLDCRGRAFRWSKETWPWCRANWTGRTPPIDLKRFQRAESQHGEVEDGHSRGGAAGAVVAVRGALLAFCLPRTIVVDLRVFL